jgi:hypothetical protein
MHRSLYILCMRIFAHHLLSHLWNQTRGAGGGGNTRLRLRGRGEPIWTPGEKTWHSVYSVGGNIPRIEEGRVERQIKVLIKHLATFFLLPGKKFLPISFKNQLLETSTQWQKEQRQKQLDVSLFWCLFPSYTFWIFCNLLLLFTFCQVCLPVKETAEIETGIAEKSSWDEANIRQKLGLLGEMERKWSKTTFTYRSSS